MSIVKSFSVGEGDMFYINHNSDNFSTIDCSLSDWNNDRIVGELKRESNGKKITRFISTHPDDDHVRQLDYLDYEMPIVNFYCVENKTTKQDEKDGFKRYKDLRDSDKAFYVSKGCKRKWMNLNGENEKGEYIGSAGINFHWPLTNNPEFKDALEKAKNGESPNNISPIFTYSIENGATLIWLGDLENDFMEKIKDELNLPKVNILFAPHHGRKSGKVPSELMEKMNPEIIIMGEAHSEDLDYPAYDDYNKITQNSAGDITFDCIERKIHIYVSNENYKVGFLDDEKKPDNFGCFYLGTLNF